jgi:hypothetical protein
MTMTKLGFIQTSTGIVMLASLFMLVFNTAKATENETTAPVYYKNTETIPYTVLKTIDKNIEIRHYPPTVAVQAGGDSDNSAFRILFNYISGGNSVRSKVAMTSPVEMGSVDTISAKIAMTSPVEMQNNQMRFFLPSMYSFETAPKPTDPRVKLIPVPERTVAVISFSGRATDSARNKQTQTLISALAQAGIETQSGISYMGYDSPFTLPWNRRNEVMIQVEYN